MLVLFGIDVIPSLYCLQSSEVSDTVLGCWFFGGKLHRSLMKDWIFTKFGVLWGWELWFPLGNSALHVPLISAHKKMHVDPGSRWYWKQQSGKWGLYLTEQSGNENHTQPGNQRRRTPGLARSRYISTGADSANHIQRLSASNRLLRVYRHFTSTAVAGGLSWC